MKVTSNKLLNYIRCRRFAALHDHNSDTNPLLNDQYYQKSLSKFKDIFLSLNYEENMQYEQDIEYTYDFYHDFTLSENFDVIFNDSDIYIMVTESSKNFLKIRYKEMDKTHQLFKKNQDGHYQMVDDVEYSLNYDRNVARMKELHEITGQVIFKYAFMSYLYHNVFPKKRYHIYVVMLNEDYIHNGLSFDEKLYHIFDFSNIDDLDKTIEISLFRMINHIELNDVTPCPLIKNACMIGKKSACKFVSYCYGHLPEKNSILDYFDTHLGFHEPLKETKVHHDTFELLNDGYIKMEDIPMDWLSHKNRLMQRYCLDNQVQYIHKEKIHVMLKHLRYPLTYLDLSLMPTIIPKFKGERPFEVLGFQYSIYYQEDEQTLDFHDQAFINSFKETRTDTRVEFANRFAEHLLAYDGDILVYHKPRLFSVFESIKVVFPSLKGKFDQVTKRLVDILDILMIDRKFLKSKDIKDSDLTTYNFYDNELSGQYSRKNLAKVFGLDEMNQLQIHDDETEYRTFRLYHGYDQNKKQVMRNQMGLYSQYKAYLLVQIISQLNEKI